MLTATDGLVLPTTVTGSWPRPTWYKRGLWGRPLSEALVDVEYREELMDAVAVVISDQERAGLDILTNGDYHFDADLAGQSWMRYPVERMRGASGPESPVAPEGPHPPGTILSEIVAGWRMPAVIGEIEPGGPLEFAKLWRIAQGKTDRPVKFGTVSAQFVASMLELRTDRYAPNKRDLMWDMATAMNSELRQLADAGCKVIQIEEPLLHFLSASSPREREYVDFLIDCLNHEIEGLDDVEVWIHTCFGNANMQRTSGSASYAEAIEIFLDRVGGDVWTVEMKDRNYGDLELFRPYRDRMKKKIALGVVSHRSLQVESPAEVAEDIRYALNYLDPDKLVLSSDCGFGRGGSNRLVAFYKATAIAQGADIVRRELGLEPKVVRAANPLVQVDAPGIAAGPRT
jgi:5-methyltetrahydropteroyltriglutamate--homocysteine methyltransferase